MPSFLLGGFVRYNMSTARTIHTCNSVMEKNNLRGWYSIFPDNEDRSTYRFLLTGSAPYYSIGLGLAGGFGRNSIINVSVDYFISTIDEIEYEMLNNKFDPAQEGQTGVVLRQADIRESRPVITVW